MNAVIIEKCEIISFGCISNKIITPTKGINLITKILLKYHFM